MEEIELKLKTSDGEVNLKFNDECGDLTWMKLTRYFSYALKGLGYFPTKLEDFLDSEDINYEKTIGKIGE